MRAAELYEAVGRESQHIEDILYIDGPSAAVEAIDNLKNMVASPKRINIKWDGTPAVRFGRDDQGRFHFADKYAKELVSTADALKDYYMKKVKGEASESRVDFISMMTRLHEIFQRATPANFRGFIHADLLWSQTPPIKNNQYVFEPNTVRYFVDKDSDLGKLIALSQAGAAAVMYQQTLTDKFQPIGNQWQMVGSDELVIVGPVSAIETTIDIDTTALDSLQSQIRSTQSAIEDFIEPEPGLADIRAIIYNFVNQQAATGSIKDLSNRFPNWVQAHDRISAGKKEKIAAKIETNQAGMRALFELVEQITAIKKQIIQQLEQPTLDTVGMRAELIDGTPGGEGFVDVSGVKLVDRETFSRANFAKTR